MAVGCPLPVQCCNIIPASNGVKDVGALNNDVKGVGMMIMLILGRKVGGRGIPSLWLSPSLCLQHPYIECTCTVYMEYIEVNILY